ncbi:MAG: UDP-N-acetylmuramoyl-tripeptide--D-alanyl-D-alanine ligase [Patescibacteria group bacterium]|nr:UDP-N-acetylmuramoyl-tripeptide--D-alanyl-D-alanine ligase [Patescibacteria group bacterium]
MTIIFYLISTFFFLWVFRNILFWVSLWQIKEYRFDRLYVHLKETYQGRRLLFSPFSIIKWIALFSFVLVILNDDSLLPYQFLIAVIFSVQGFSVLKEISLRLIKRPVLTFKAIFIVLASLLSVFLLYVFPLVDKFFWLLFIDRLLPLFVVLFIFFLSFPTQLLRDWKIENAAKKVTKFKNLLTIGITGSYGKSTTKEFTAQILSQKFNVLKTKANYNTPIGIANTVLSGLTKKTEIFVVEMGAYKIGEIEELCEIVNPRIGILTAVNNQHLSLFGSFENTLSAKYELIDALPKNGLALFNGNNPNSFSLFNKTHKKKVLYLNIKDKDTEKIKSKADIIAFNTRVEKDSVSFQVLLKDKTISLNAPFIGEHNVENVLPAIYIADHLGMSEEEIKYAVSRLSLPDKTLSIKNIEGVYFVDDSYNANPEAVSAILNYMKFYKGKKILVLQPMIELGGKAGKEHFEIAKQASKICDYLIMTNKNFYKSIIKGIKEGGGECEVRVLKSLQIADFIENIAEKGDVAIFEGKESALALEKIL